jgi:separase
LKQYWDFILAKYEVGSSTPSDFSHSKTISLLPDHWTVVTINVTEDKNTLFISRQRASKEPLVFSVPLTGRREDDACDGDGHFTLERALEELNDIVKLSNEGTREAITVQKDKPEAKAAWWKTRIELDGRMKELLENIEFCWLGAFKVNFFEALVKWSNSLLAYIN